jgi:predicted phosphodiesterase
LTACYPDILGFGQKNLMPLASLKHDASEMRVEMRVFALSDIHIDYNANAKWIESLSLAEYKNDVLILAGDVTDIQKLLDWGLNMFTKRFKKVLFVPGNHELWVIRENGEKNSLQKFDDVCAVVKSTGASMEAFHEQGVSIIPLLGWYDYSFGEPSNELKSTWMDYCSCRWPTGLTDQDIAARFIALNDGQNSVAGNKVITYSHFLPRIDLMPEFIPSMHRILYPVLGSVQLERQLRKLKPDIHVYGHSHVNRQVKIDDVLYINNAFGYPSETRTSKQLICIHEC